MKYPLAEQVEWVYNVDGRPAYFYGNNRPEAVVIHVMQGYRSTARQWALSGHYGASWHYTVGRDGSVMQHLRHEDGGYHAGIPQSAPAPAWPLWKGHAVNVNTYTIGIECEGFSGDGFTEDQAASLKALCKWLSANLGIPFDRDHFPAHADIDLVNRPNDFAPREQREAFYAYLFDEEDDMTPDEVAAIAAGQFLELLAQAVGAKESTFSDGAMVAAIRKHLAAETVPDHYHKTTSTTVQLGGVVR